MEIVLRTSEEAQAVAKRMFWLAYEVSSVVGAGFLQAREGATEDDVWENVNTRGDYPGRADMESAPQKAPYGDYVFGRMMKWGCFLHGRNIRIPETSFHPGY